MSFLDGLLGSGWEDPRSAAMMALAAGLIRRDPGGGLLAANQAFSDSKKSKLQEGLLSAQMDNYRSEIAKREADMERAKEEQKFGMALYNGGLLGPQAPQGAPGGAPGAPGAPAGVPAGAAQAMGNPQFRSFLGSLSEDQLVGLMKIGKLPPGTEKLWEIAKFGKSSQQGEFQTFSNGEQRMTPMVKEGLGFGPQGVSVLPGAAQAQSSLTYANESAKARAAAESDVVKVYNPATQREELVPRAQVLGRQQQMPAQMPQQMPPMQPQGMPQGLPPPQAGVRGNFMGDPAQVMEAIMQMRDPQERANAMAAFQEQAKRTQGFTQGAGFAAGPSAQEAADAAGAKERAVAGAQADVKRDSVNRDELKRFAQMQAGISQAVDILKMGPTASGAGAMVGSAAAFLGKSTPGADMASRLDTISGWLVNNVPRMEGPQSNFDVQNYKTMAGLVGDRTKPVSQRLAAAEEVMKLQGKYAALNGGQAPAQEAPAALRFDAKPPANASNKGKYLRDEATGQRWQSNGFTWVEVK